MNKIEAYQCSICGIVHADENYIKEHEDYCIAEVQYELKRHAEQNKAREYLGTFRTRAASVRHLIQLLNDEREEIVDAHCVIEYYNTPKAISPLIITGYKSHGFATPQKPHPKPASHSAPIGKKLWNMWPGQPKEEQALAFELEFYTAQQKKDIKYSFDWIFTHIAGVNQGSAGSWGPSTCHTNHCSDDTTHHHYITFWIDDWCKGFA
ncbi:hypothetical protein NVP2275O_482 [Vibrio phage 2.275.O._10N.286.54.E11]|nr:hypothetical protein NVP2275O_482 [Vibrio phage 2.275.O._10N.286.54.E11]